MVFQAKSRSNPARIELTGLKFGRLTVVKKSGNRKTGESIWECLCECGKSTKVTSSKLRNGRTASCGCGRGEFHDKSLSAEYRVWQGMKRRCCYEFNEDYYLYGGRGITICERWKNSFQAFFEDMGKRPSSIHSIDRIDSNGNYEPGNCRWATPSQQSNNRRSNVIIEFNGVKAGTEYWSKITGIPAEQITRRLGRGWSIERALTQKLRGRLSDATSK